MSLDYLRIYQSDYKKVRIGPNKDGGYILADGLNYDCFITCGISDDIEFEKEFLLKNPNMECVAHDGTINALPEEHDRIVFVKKNISYFNSDKTTNLFDMFEKYNNILLKMDIETYEYRWLQTLSLEQFGKIKQLIIEFHFPFTEPGFTHLDTPLPINQKLDILKKLSETHVLIHLHPNNCCGTTVYDNTTVPNVFECTYVRKDIQSKNNFNSDIIPTLLDRPNIDNIEICLSGYPFVIFKTISN